MSLADDLRGKLDSAIGDLANLKVKLYEIESLEESLRDANGQLAQTSSRVSELAASARAAQESLDLTVKALEQATEVMMRLEPAVITAAIQEADTSIKAAIEENSTKLSGIVTERVHEVKQSISTSQEAVQLQVREQEAQHIERHAKDARVFRWISSFTILALVAVVVLGVFTVFSVR